MRLSTCENSQTRVPRILCGAIQIESRRDVFKFNPPDERSKKNRSEAWFQTTLSSFRPAAALPFRLPIHFSRLLRCNLDPIERISPDTPKPLHIG